MEQQFDEMQPVVRRRHVNVMRCAGLVVAIASILSTAIKAMPA